MSPEQEAEVLDLVSIVISSYFDLCNGPYKLSDVVQVLMIIHKLSVAMILMQEVLGSLRAVVTILSSRMVRVA